MPNETDDLKKPELDESKDTSGHNEIDRIANKAAAKAGKRENRYDQNHGTFPGADLPECHKSGSLSKKPRWGVTMSELRLMRGAPELEANGELYSRIPFQVAKTLLE